MCYITAGLMMQHMPSFEGVVVGASKLMRRYNDVFFLWGWCEETVKDGRIFLLQVASSLGSFFVN